MGISSSHPGTHRVFCEGSVAVCLRPGLYSTLCKNDTKESPWIKQSTYPKGRGRLLLGQRGFLYREQPADAICFSFCWPHQHFCYGLPLPRTQSYKLFI